MCANVTCCHSFTAHKMWRLRVSSNKQRDQKQEERQKERKNERHAGEKGWEKVPAPVRPS